MGEALARTDVVPAAIERAQALVTEALALLDRVGAAADIGAHLDLALHRMTAEIEGAA